MMLELSPLRHGGEGVGRLDAGLARGRPGRSRCRSPWSPLKRRAQPAERVGVAVDDGDGVAAVLEAAGQRRADPAAAHDHDVHARDATTSRTVDASADGPRRCGLALPPTWASATSPSGSCSAASCAARSSARRCCPSASRCRSSPATRCRRWPTRPTRSSSCSRVAGVVGVRLSLEDRHRRRARDAHRGRVVPAERARLPQRRRRLRGRHRQPRADAPGSPWPARCSSTTCSPSRCRSPRACRTPPRRSRFVSRARGDLVAASWCSCSRR